MEAGVVDAEASGRTPHRAWTGAPPDHRETPRDPRSLRHHPLRHSDPEPAKLLETMRATVDRLGCTILGELSELTVLFQPPTTCSRMLAKLLTTTGQR